MFYFLMPRQDGSVFSHTIVSGNLLDAYHQFKQVWTPELNWTIGVWLEDSLVAMVGPVADDGQVRPVIHLIR